MTAERIVVLSLRGLALCFFAVGVLFVAAPGGVLDVLDDVGDWLGSFDPAPDTGARLWLSLAFAYMMVITAIAWLASTDLERYRPLILVLAVAKAASSLAALAYYVFDEQVFAYLLNFVVDGALVLVSLGLWALAGRARAAPGAAAPEARAPV